MDQYKTRSDIPEAYRWNLSLVYKDGAQWDQDFVKIDSHAAAVEAFKGKLATDASTLKSAFETQEKLDLLIEKLYAYAHHLSDEDTRDAANLGRVGRIAGKAAEVGARLSWMDPELLETPVEKLKKY